MLLETSPGRLTIEVIQQTEGVKFIATVTRGFPDPLVGITMKQVFSPSIKDNHVGQAIFGDFLAQGA